MIRTLHELNAYLLLVGDERRRRGVQQGDAERPDGVVVGAALQRREHRRVDALLEVVQRAGGLARQQPRRGLGAL